MKKRIFIGLAALLMAFGMTGCWDDDDVDTTPKETTASTSATTEAPATEETTTEEATTEEPSTEEETTTPEPSDTTEETSDTTEAPTEPTGPPQGGPPQQQLNLDAQFDESKFLHYVDMPTCVPDAEAKEADFAGLWVVDVMAKNDVAYDAICGIPVFATGHLEIEAHNPAFDEMGSGKFINIKPVVVADTSNLPAQAQAQAAQSSEAEETELPLTYTFENGVLNASVTIPVGPPKSVQAATGAAPGIQGPPPKQMVLQMTDDDRILVQSFGADGTVTSAYYKKVDAFEPFDWASVQFDFESVYAE